MKDEAEAMVADEVEGSPPPSLEKHANGADTLPGGDAANAHNKEEEDSSPCNSTTANGNGIFSWTLQCDRTAPPGATLWWQSDSPCPAVPLAAEHAVLPLLMKYGRKERRMMKDKPSYVIDKVQAICAKQHISLLAACSLRRTHMCYEARRPPPAVGLGNEADIRQAAHLFEQAIHEHLLRCNVQFYTEQEQRQHIGQYLAENPGAKSPPTPDFQLKVPLVLKRYVWEYPKDKYVVGKPRPKPVKKVFKEVKIHWIEVKMFYGASSVPWDNNKGAVGSLYATAQKYTQHYGPGALVFLYGYGEPLEEALAAIGVTCLDVMGERQIDLQPVWAHLKTWCADKKGRILP